MAYPRLRSMNDDLRLGAVEGSMKLVAPDRGGAVEPTFMELRRTLDDVYYGFHEESSKPIPGVCVTTNTPTYLPTATPDSTKW